MLVPLIFLLYLFLMFFYLVLEGLSDPCWLFLELVFSFLSLLHELLNGDLFDFESEFLLEEDDLFLEPLDDRLVLGELVKHFVFGELIFVFGHADNYLCQKRQNLSFPQPIIFIFVQLIPQLFHRIQV